MKTFRWPTLILLLLCLSSNLTAQVSYKTRLINTDDGLSHRYVRDVVRDDLGFLWIATDNGLNRWDGHRFLTYHSHSDAPNRISNDKLLSVHLREDGKIVVVNADHTLDIIDPKKNEVTAIDIGTLTEPPSQIRTSYQDDKGRLYFLTENEHGIYLISNRGTEPVVLWEILEARPTSPELTNRYFSRLHILSESDGNFLIADMEKGIYRVDSNGKVFDGPLIDAHRIPPSDGLRFNFLVRDDSGRVWLAIQNEPGVYQLNDRMNRFELHQKIPRDINYITAWCDDVGNVIFANPGVEENLSAWLLTAEDELQDYSSVMQNPHSGMKVGGKDFTDYLFELSIDGMHITELQKSIVDSYLDSKEGVGQIGVSMRGITEDYLGHVIINTEQNGWYRLVNGTGSIESIDFDADARDDLRPPTFCRNFVHDEDGYIWTSSYSQHMGPETPSGYLIRYDPKSQSVTSYRTPHRTEALAYSSDGRLWLGGIQSLAIFDPPSSAITSHQDREGSSPVGDRTVRYILEHSGLIHVATSDGLIIIDPQKQTSELINVPVVNDILTIAITADDRLMLGTLGHGVAIYDPVSQSFEHLTSRDGLANDNVCGILPTNNGDYWISTYNGLSYYQASTRQFRNFFTSHGFNHNEFNRFAHLKSTSGKLYFGGMNGFNVFHPEDLLQTNPAPNFILSSLTYHQSERDSSVTQHFGLEGVHDLILPAAHRYLQIRFGLDDYRNPSLNRYAYFLEGYDQEWTQLGSRSDLTFNNLPAGEYTLHLRGFGQDGLWSEERSVNLRVKDFFYNSLWFYLGCFILLVAVATWWILRLRSQKRLLEEEVQRRTEDIRQDKVKIEEQAQQLKELDRFKSRFYTHITHEFRTPLTVIMGMADEIEGNPTAKKLIHRNGQSLLNLINQLLELSKIEFGQMSLDLQQGDIVQYIHYLLESFHPLAAAHNIKLNVSTDLDRFEMAFDSEKVHHLVSNLISNALKFTPADGVVSIDIGAKVASSSGQEVFVIQVKDTGSGIPVDQIPYLFDLFYQVDQTAEEVRQLGSYADGSSGIGLALVKELITHMGGTIKVSSKVGLGSTFEIAIPVLHTDEAADELLANRSTLALSGLASDDPIENVIGSNEDPLLLIIEDNVDVAYYIKSCVSKDYRIIIAKDGHEGLDLAYEEVPDLIISDVMMPKMDGYEVCTTLKKDRRTSHIPIVLLTAKSDRDSRIAGLEHGADVYLSKPFDKRELLVRLRKLSELRHELQEKYKSINTTKELQSLPTDLEASFLMEVRECVESNLGNDKLGVKFLCQSMHISQPQLYRKIKALTDQSPSVYIRTVRLQKGHELLSGTSASIADIAYQTGFADPNYFSRNFRNHYGMSPTDARALARESAS